VKKRWKWTRTSCQENVEILTLFDITQFVRILASRILFDFKPYSPNTNCTCHEDLKVKIRWEHAGPSCQKSVKILTFFDITQFRKPDVILLQIIVSEHEFYLSRRFESENTLVAGETIMSEKCQYFDTF